MSVAAGVGIGLGKRVVRDLDVRDGRVLLRADLNVPLIAGKGATIEEIAKTLHKGLAQKFKYAKVWGSTKFPGQRVSRNYKPRDFDVIEIYG